MAAWDAALPIGLGRRQQGRVEVDSGMGEGEVAAGQQGVDEPSPMPYGSSASGTKGRTAILNHRVSSQACWIRRSLPRNTMIIAPCWLDDAGEETTASRAVAVSLGLDRVDIVNKGPAVRWSVYGVRAVRHVQLGCGPGAGQQQFQATVRIPRSGKKPGDLIFFGTPGNITHLGIYAGNGYMWAAPQTRRNVNLQPIYSSSYYVGRVR